MMLALEDVQTAHSNAGASLLVWRAIVAVLIGVAGIVAALILRKRLLRLMASRTRRILVEVLLLGVLQLLNVGIVAILDLHGILRSGQLTDADNRLVWGLAVCFGLLIAVQAFAVLHADAAEVD